MFYNVIGLGEGGLVESPKLAQMSVPLLPNCLLYAVFIGYPNKFN